MINTKTPSSTPTSVVRKRMPKYFCRVLIIAPAPRPRGALARGARRAQERKADQDEGKRVERSEQAVVKLGAELSRLFLVLRVLGVGRDQLPEVALAHGIFDNRRRAAELRKVEG